VPPVLFTHLPFACLVSVTMPNPEPIVGEARQFKWRLGDCTTLVRFNAPDERMVRRSRSVYSLRDHIAWQTGPLECSDTRICDLNIKNVFKKFICKVYGVTQGRCNYPGTKDGSIHIRQGKRGWLDGREPIDFVVNIDKPAGTLKPQSF
jgi:hypothetical protein